MVSGCTSEYVLNAQFRALYDNVLAKDQVQEGNFIYDVRGIVKHAKTRLYLCVLVHPAQNPHG